MLVPFPSSIDAIQNAHQTTVPTNHSAEYWPLSVLHAYLEWRFPRTFALAVCCAWGAYPQDLFMATPHHSALSPNHVTLAKSPKLQALPIPLLV